MARPALLAGLGKGASGETCAGGVAVGSFWLLDSLIESDENLNRKSDVFDFMKRS